MSREIVESVKVVIKTDDGNRICVECRGGGSATSGMLSAFTCLPTARRIKLLASLQARHHEIEAREIAGGASC